MDPYLGQNLGNVAPLAGKLIGSSVGGPAGGKIGQVAGEIVKGIAGQASAKKLKNQAESLFPQYEDPRQLARLAQLQQMQRSLETGTGAMTQAAKGAAEQGMAGTQAGIVRSTGGDVGSTIQGLLQSQRVGGENINAAFAKGQEAAMQMNPLIEALNKQISSRKMELQLAQSQRKDAQWAKMQQQVNQNLNAGLARAQGNINQNTQESPAPEGIASSMSSITQPGSSMESNNFLSTNRYSNMDRPPTPAFEEMGGENQGGNIGSRLKGFLGNVLDNIKNKRTEMLSKRLQPKQKPIKRGGYGDTGEDFENPSINEKKDNKVNEIIENVEDFSKNIIQKVKNKRQDKLKEKVAFKPKQMPNRPQDDYFYNPNDEDVVIQEEQIQEEVPVKAKKKRKDLLGFLRAKKLNKDLTWSDWQAMKAAEQEIE